MLILKFTFIYSRASLQHFQYIDLYRVVCVWKFKIYSRAFFQHFQHIGLYISSEPNSIWFPS